MLPRRGRALSNTIAGLIVLTFLIVVFVPLIINMLTTTTQGSIKLAQSLIQKIAESAPALNVTYNPSASSPPVTRVYDVINTDTQDHTLTLMTIEDANGQLYMVKPGACVVTACTAGTASVKVILVDNAVRLDDRVLLHPRGVVRVEVEYGKLLGILLYSGAYAKVLTPPPAPVTNATVAQYAAVAGSVKTNYFELSSFTDLADLLSSTSVALTTDPASNSSDPTILWRNMIVSACYVDDTNVTGGFQPLSDLNGTHIDGLVFYNIEPYGGSYIVGGGGGSYNSYPFSVRMLMTAYGFAAPNSSEPGLIVAKNGYEWVAVFTVPTKYMMFFENVSGTDPAILALRNFLPQHVYKTQLTTRSLEDEERNIVWDNVQAIFDVPYWGVILRYVDSSGDIYLLYCPANTANVAEEPGGVAAVTVPECYGVRYGGIRSSWWGYYIDVGEYHLYNATIYINPEGYNGDAATGYIWGNYSYTHVTATLAREYSVTTSADTVAYEEPFKLKLSAETTLLAIYDNGTRALQRDKNAFGYYYYNGYVMYDYDRYGNVYALMYIDNYIQYMALRDVTLTVFGFQPGTTSGIEPYSAIMDTDGNGLMEIVFSTEDEGPGWKNTWDDMSGDTVELTYVAQWGWRTVQLVNYAYEGVLIGDNIVTSFRVGCEDQTINKVYLKFIGSQYAVNGTEIAQVSIQIRYTFHDNAGDDVEDVDDPKQYIMSFQLIAPNGTVFMSSDYIYQQLQDIEDTWPPNTNWVSDSVFLLVPNENKLFYVAFAVNDPYGWESQNNDPDFTLAVEWLGMWYLHR